jgi:WD40 repeat protein/serine/threonine protein kinase/tetratricopeptide (TPR) repeat protein
MEPSKSGAYDLLDQLVEEFAERYRRGQRPSLQEYIDKYPHLADDLREVLPAMMEIGQVEEDQRKAVVPAPAPAALPLQAVGDYRIIREIGRGGMGVVYEAEQQSLGRRVALKVLSAQVIGDGKALERFRREARSAARLHHTNIVPVFDVGQEGDVCYYAMQFIQGQSLDQVVDELRRLSVGSASRGPQPPEDPRSQLSQVAHSLLTGRFEPQRLAVSPAADAAREGDLTADNVPSAPGATPPSGAATASTTSAVLPGQVELSRVEGDHRHYFRSVARVGQQTATALVYAHARGIVHRDVKPSNLLLDGSGVVWVTDFGLAKTEDEGLTNTGELPGTLRYMSPERFQGHCDLRTDVYALGLTLYEMLVLKPAFEASDRYRLIEQILQQEPARPRSIDPQIPRDLETIVLKAIDREPRRRYQTAEELEEDLRRYLADEPIRARRVTPAERLARWSQRNPAVAGLVAAVALSLLLGTCVATFFAIRANDNAAQARAKEQDALRQKAAADAARLAASTASDEAAAARDQVKQDLYYAEMNRAGQTVEVASGVAHKLLAHWRPSGNEPDRRGWEWYYLDGLVHQELLTLHRHTGIVGAVSWSPDGRLLASASEDGTDGTVMVWNAATGREVFTLRGRKRDWISSLAWSPDSRLLASVRVDQTIDVWEVETGTEEARINDTEGAHAVSWSPDGKQLAVAGSWNGAIRLWSLNTGRRIARLVGHRGTVYGMSWSPDGRRLATASHDHTVRVWNVEAAQETAIFRGHTAPVFAVDWSPDGRSIASAGDDQTVQVWTPNAGPAAVVLRGHRNAVYAARWSPDGRQLASAGADHTVRVWNQDQGWEVTLFPGHTDLVRAVCWSPDGKRLASAGADQTVRVWEVKARQASSILGRHGSGVTAASWSPDGQWLASAGADRTIKLWDAIVGREAATLGGHRDEVLTVSWSPDGKRLASAGKDRTIRVWDRATGRELASLQGHGGAVWAVGWSPKEEILASAGDDQTIRLWDLSTRHDLATLTLHGLDAGFLGVSWSPDGQMLASCGTDMTLRLWNRATQQEMKNLRGHSDPTVAVSWSPDGKRLASASRDATIKLWDVEKGQEMASLHGHLAPVSGVSWSPDGKRLASASDDETLKVWNVATGQEVVTLRGHTKGVRGVSWSPDGRRLASASQDGTVRLWDVARGYLVERSPLLLPEIERRLGAEPQSVPDLRLRSEIQARLGHWDEAAADWSRAVRPQECTTAQWFQAGWWVARASAATSGNVAESEADLDPTRPLPSADSNAGGAAPLHWQVATASSNGCLDLGALFPEAKGDPAYALLRVYSPEEQRITALIGGSGPLLFWQNGQRLCDAHETRVAQTADEGVPLLLRAGWNSLLFKVGIGTATKRLCVRLSAESADCIRALIGQGQWEEAEARLKDTLKQQPSQAHALLLAAQVYRQRSDSLRLQGQNEQADQADSQARASYEQLLTLFPNHAGYAAEFADFLESRSAPWQVLYRVATVAAHGTTLTPQPDGSILAGGDNPRPETYTITARTRLAGITAVRLEVLPDPSLPRGGPGLAPNGNLVLNEFRVTAAPESNPDGARPVVLHNAWADYSQGGYPVQAAVDGDPSTGWALWPEVGQAHAAVFELKEPINNTGGTVLTFTLEQHLDAHNVGRFRLSVTASQGLLEERWRRILAGVNPSPWTRIGTALYLRGEWPAALTALQKATALPSGGNGWDQVLLTLVHEHLGRPYEPATAEAWVSRAAAYLELGEQDKALANAARAVELKPKDLTVRRARMELCARLKKWDDALADCIKAVELKPDDPELLPLRADLYACCGQWAPAADDFAKLTEMDPAIYPRPWLPWYRQALTLLAAGKPEEYRKACARMLDHFKDTDDADTAFFTAWTCGLGPDALPDFAPALRLAEKALAQGDHNARSHQAVGALHYRAGRWEECVKHFHAAEAAADPQDQTSSAYWYYFLAMAEHRLGHKDEARQWLDKAVAQTDKELRDEAQTSGPDRWVRKATLQVLRAEAEALLRDTAAGPAK